MDCKNKMALWFKAFDNAKKSTQWADWEDDNELMDNALKLYYKYLKDNANDNKQIICITIMGANISTDKPKGTTAEIKKVGLEEPLINKDSKKSKSS